MKKLDQHIRRYSFKSKAERKWCWFKGGKISYYWSNVIKHIMYRYQNIILNRRRGGLQSWRHRFWDNIIHKIFLCKSPYRPSFRVPDTEGSHIHINMEATVFGTVRELLITASRSGKGPEGPQQTNKLQLPEQVAYGGGFPLMLPVCTHRNKRESHLSLDSAGQSTG